MINNNYDTSDFENQWRILSIRISQTLYILPEIQRLKHSLQTNGFLTLEEKSKFINLCNQVKYQVIEEEYGKEGTEGYNKFNESWKAWFETKGVESEHSKGQRDSIEHIMFGSTPDPERFIMNFEQEIMGSIK